MNETNDTPGRVARAPKGLRQIVLGVLGMFMWPLFFLGFSGAPACMGFEDPTLATLAACPEIATALGTPIQRSWFGFSCGNAESGGGFGNASWSFPVTGPNGRGTVSVVAEERGGPWTILRADVEIDGRTIDALACARGAGVPSAAGVAVPSVLAPALGPPITARTLSATVATAVGAAPAASGTSCEIALEPASGAFDCRAQITCGGTVIYGAGGAGFATCATDAAGHVTFMDSTTSPAGGDPILTLTLGTGNGMMTDTSPAGTWMVTFTFPPG